MERKARSMDTFAFIDFRRDVVSRFGGARSDMLLGTKVLDETLARAVKLVGWKIM